MVSISLRMTVQEARKFLNDSLASGEIRFPVKSDHAVEEMENDGLLMPDVLSVLRVGRVQEPEWEGGEWRYRVETFRIVVVVAFEEETRTVIVTAFERK